MTQKKPGKPIVHLMVMLLISLGCEDFDEAFETDSSENRDHRGGEVCSLSSASSDLCNPYEAEDRTAARDCEEATNFSGYTGSSFIDFGGNGAWIEWNNIDVLRAGEFTLTFRYANGRTSPRTSAVIVNGTTAHSAEFPGTGSWRNWKTLSMKVALRQGRNVIRLKATTDRGGPNLDHVLVIGNNVPEDACPDDPNKTEPGQCGCGVPEGTCSTSETRYEAENRTAASGCLLASNHAGFTGAGFMDFGGNGTWIEWNNIAAPTAGEYSLSFRYGNGGTGNRQAAVIVNNQQTIDAPFPPTGSWKNWRTSSIKLSLRRGNNTVRVRANTGSGGPNLDHIVVTGDNNDQCPDDPQKTEPGECGCGVPEGSCDECENTLPANATLLPGQHICSKNGDHEFGLSSGGELAIWSKDGKPWSAGTFGNSVHVIMQGDGNLVVYNPTKALWSSRTPGNAGAYLSLENDGRAVIRLGSRELWSTDTVKPPQELTFPIRGVFYYPWFPQTWMVDGVHVFYHPDLGYYSSDSQKAVDRHIECMEYGKIHVGIASWWGIKKQNETVRIPLLLDRTVARGAKVKWTLYYEKVGFPDRFDTSVAAIRADLEYLKRNYTSHKAYAHINGKPVIFTYNTNDKTCNITNRFLEAAKTDWYVVLKVVGGYQSCKNQPDAWHQYGPSTAVHQHGGHSYVISPGFWKANEAKPRLTRDKNRWYQNVRDMAASKEPWHLITSFNEWGEGTAIEPTREWKSDSGFGVYLDALHSDGR